MNKIFYIISVLLLYGGHLYSQEFKYLERNDIRYRIITEADGAATFGTVSVAPSEYNDYEGDMEIPMIVKDSEDEYAESYRVVGIDDQAFRKANVKTIKLPSSIEFIGNYAFSKSKLISVTIPIGNLKNIGNHAFSETSLVEIILPANLKNIGRCAFANCKDLVRAGLKDGIISLGDSAFFQCSKLKECHIPTNLAKIEDFTFCGCTNLQNLSLGDNIKMIGKNAFAFCASLSSLELPSSLRVIKAYAFAHSGIKDIVIPEKVKVISWGTFYNSQLRNIKLPETLETIETDAFYGTKLYSINIPQTTNVKYGGLFGAKIQDDKQSVEKKQQAPPNISIIKVNETETEIMPVNSSNPEEVSKYRIIKIRKNNYLILSEPDEKSEYGQLRLSLWDPKATGDVTVPDAIEIQGKSGNKLYLITEIAPSAFDNTENKDRLQDFYSRPGVKYVKLGKVISKIHEGAFAFSTIQKVDLPDIPLPRYLFKNSCLKSFKFTSKMKVIPTGFFSGCELLTSIIIPPHIKQIGGDAFAGTSISKIVIPNGVTKIRPETFRGCKNLKEVVLPNSVDSIFKEAFRFSSIGNFVIPNTIKYIGEEAFANCENMKIVTMPIDATIHPYAFASNSIEHVIIANGATEVKRKAFERFFKLKKVTLPSTITKIGDEAFRNTPIETIDIPEGVKEIGVSAFARCDSLKSITIPSTVQTIKREAFAGCENLSAVTIKDGVVDIGDRAFGECPIEYLIIPASVQKVSHRAFFGTKTVWIRCDMSKWRSSSAIFDKTKLQWYKLDIPYSGYIDSLGLTTLKQ